MCGLAAFIKPGHVFNSNVLDNVEQDLFHRGPDSGGQEKSAGWALVFRRLAILDQRDVANQPMKDDTGLYSIVFNGEIYNFRKLRETLIKAGLKFYTDGDTEVLLNGYKFWGEDVIHKLEGMYAFVIIDKKQGCAFASRDPYGIKPLYFLHKNGLAAFSSEIKPLTRFIAPKVDDAALAELLTFGWAAGTMSNIEGIERVPGGMSIRVDLNNGDVKKRSVINILDTIKPDSSIDHSNVNEIFTSALEDSIRSHLISDVGYSLQLSGGIDSSLVAAIASKSSDKKISSFAVNLGDSLYDESKYRKLVVDKYELDHHEIHLTAHDFSEAMPRAIKHMEGPVPHLGCVMLMLLCEKSKESSKVVLTGEGADEFFGGYERYALWKKIKLYEIFGKIMPSSLLPDSYPFLGIKRFAKFDAATYSSIYQDIFAMHNLFPDLVPLPGARENASSKFNNFVDRMFASDQVGYLESLLVRQDKMSMAASVEARVPYVHLPLAKMVNTIPRNIRVPGRVTKPVLKKIAEKYLPKELIYRRKNGLLLPYDEWLHDDKLLGSYLGLLTDQDSCLGQYTKPGALLSIVNSFRNKRKMRYPSMIRLVNVELWLRSLSNNLASI